MKYSKAVTLFEILISMVILGGVFCGIFTSLFFGQKISMNNQDKLMAAALARGYMEELANDVGVSDTNSKCLYNSAKCHPKFEVTIDNTKFTVGLTSNGDVGSTHVSSASINITWDERKTK